jgi:hypothetical protein
LYNLEGSGKDEMVDIEGHGEAEVVDMEDDHEDARSCCYCRETDLCDVLRFCENEACFGAGRWCHRQCLSWVADWTEKWLCVDCELEDSAHSQGDKNEIDEGYVDEGVSGKDESANMDSCPGDYRRCYYCDFIDDVVNMRFYEGEVCAGSRKWFHLKCPPQT